MKFEFITADLLVDWIEKGMTFSDNQLFFQKTKPLLDLFIENMGLDYLKDKKEELKNNLSIFLKSWPEFEKHFAERFPDYMDYPKKHFGGFYEACFFFQKDLLIEKIKEFKPDLRFGKGQKKDNIIEILRLNTTNEQQESIIAEAESLISELEQEKKACLWQNTLFESFYAAIFRKAALENGRLQMLELHEAGPLAMPFWLMHIEPSSTQCLSRYGIKRILKHRNDSFWQDNYPPHSQLGCFCRVSAHSPREIEREPELKALLEQ